MNFLKRFEVKTPYSSTLVQSMLATNCYHMLNWDSVTSTRINGGLGQCNANGKRKGGSIIKTSYIKHNFINFIEYYHFYHVNLC